VSSLETRGLGRRWGGFSLRDVSLRAEAGAYLALIGPTGSGKTLLVETIAGFHAPEAGSVIIDGVDVTELPPEKRGVGYVPQRQSLFPNMTVRENVEFGLRMRRVGEADRSRRCRDVMDSLGIGGLSDRGTLSLSGGERQKVALARALALEPRVLILDEPLSSVDAVTHRDLVKVLRRTHRESGATFIHVTHSHEEASVLANAVGVLIGGRIAQQGAYIDVYSRPASSEAAALLGFENVYGVAAATESSVEVGGRALSHSGGLGAGSRYCGFRAESVEVNAARPGGVNVFEGTVTDSLGVGDAGRIVVDAGFPVVAPRRDPEFSLGQRVYVRVPPESIVLWDS
jgi:ABC-type Fe3+/spermidine/putrescine transport system ATPase subunit